MLKLFEYNWQVRKDWLDWCDTVSEEELLKKRTGGIGYFFPRCITSWGSSMVGYAAESLKKQLKSLLLRKWQVCSRLRIFLHAATKKLLHLSMIGTTAWKTVL